MSVDILRSIRDTELEADRIKKQSALDARQVIADANSRSHKLLEQETQEAEQQYAQILEQAGDKAQSRIAELKGEADRECAEIIRCAEGNMDRAVDIITGRILNTYGNS